MVPTDMLYNHSRPFTGPQCVMSSSGVACPDASEIKLSSVQRTTITRRELQYLANQGILPLKLQQQPSQASCPHRLLIG
jgi:hypothetical protein